MSRDLVYRVVMALALAIAVGVPVLAYREAMLLARRRRRSPGAVHIGAAAMALIPALTLSPIVIALGFCAGAPPPGESDEARRLKRDAAPVVAALDRYRSVHAEYPRRLDDLVPEFLAPGVLPLKPVQTTYPVMYSGDSTDYKLSFRYSGAGMNDCTFTPARQWECGGWY